MAAALPASAQQLWFDTNGTTTGSGNANGTWDAGTTAAWTTNSAGTAATGLFGTGNTTTAVFAAGTDFTGTRTVTIAGTVAPAGILLESEVVNLTLTGGTIDFGTTQGVIDTSAIGAGTGRIVTVGTPITGSNGLTINAHGNLTATGGGNNALLRLNADNSGLTGGIFITGGLVALPNAAAAGGNKITLSNFGGVLDTNINLQLPNDIEVLSSGGTFRTYGSVTTTNFSGTLTGSGNINRTDGGVMTLSGDASGYTGTYTNQAGTTVFTNDTWADRRFDVQVGAITFNLATNAATISPTSLTVAGTVNLNNDASLNVPVLPIRVASVSAINRPAATLGNLTSSTGTLTINGVDAGGAIATGNLTANNHTIGVDIVDADGGTTPVAVVKNGVSPLVLSNTNTYTGGTTINSGRIQASNAASFGTGTVTVNNGGQAFLAVAGPFANNFVLNGLGQPEAAGSLGALRLTGSTINGQITLAGNTRINAHTSSGTITGGIGQTGGARSLEFGGSSSAGTITLTTTAASYTGLTTISNATVNVGTTAAPAASNLLASSSGFVLGSAGGTGNGALNFNVAASYTLNQPITIGTAGSSMSFFSNDASHVVTLATTLGADPTFGSLFVSGAQLKMPTGSAVNMNSVSVTSNPANLATGAVGSLLIESGAAVTSRYFNIGDGSNTAGVVTQTGGSVTLLAGNNGFRLGHWANGLTPQNLYTLSGGTLDATALEANAGAARFINVGWDGQAAMTVGGGAGTATLKAFGIQVDANGNTAAANSTFTLANNGVVEVGGGGIAGASATDLVVLTGNNTLRATASSTVSAVINATANGTTAIDVAGGSTLTLTSTVSGTPTFNKQGPGVLQVNTALPAGLTLNATAGRVQFGTAANAATNVNVSGATELVAAVNVGNLSTSSGVSIYPGANSADSTIGTLAAATANLFSPTIRFNLNGANATTGGTTNDLISVTGNATVDGGVIQPVFSGAVTVGNVYTLVSAGSLAVPNAPVVDVSAVNSTRLTFAVGSTATALTLTVGGANKSLTWTGTGGSTWNLNTTSNWQDSTPAAETFYDYDDVTFDDTGAAANVVNIAGTVRPGSVTVSGTTNYTLSGTGSIASGSIAKSGTGTLILATNNTYTGTTTVTGGRLSVGDGGTSGSLGSGTVTVTTPGRLEINRSDTHTVSSVIAGNGGIDYVGSGTTIISGTNTYTGGTLITRGTLALRANAALGAGAVTVGNGTTGSDAIQIGIDNSVDIPATVSFNVPAGPTGAVIFAANSPGLGSNASTFFGVFTLNRPVTFRGAASDRLAIDGRITGNVGTLTIDGGSRTTFLSTANDFVGNVLIRGTNTILQASVGGAAETVPNNSNVDIGPGAFFQLASSANGTETISALLGSGTVTRNVANLQTLAVGFNGTPGTFSGIIQNGSGTVALNKVGGGVQSLSGASTYTGGTTVTAGILLADTPGPTNSATGTGAVTVNGGWLGGSGRIAGAVTVNPNGTIAPGPIPVVGGAVGTLTVGSPVTLATGVGVDPTLAIKVRNAAGSSDVLALSGTGTAGVLTLSNIDRLNILPVEDITTARTYTIATFASVVGEFDSVLIAGQPSQNTNPAAPNYALVTYSATNIQLTVNNVVAVPEPAAVAGMSAGLGLLALRRRRRS